jgi:TonB family protein
MYRCTECNAEYTERPDYCECGNDTFEEVLEEQVAKEEIKEVTLADFVTQDEYEEDDEEELPPPPPKKPKLTPEEKEELRLQEIEKKKSLIALGVILFLCVVVLILPPHKKQKMEKVKQKVAQEHIQLPAINTYWDDSVSSINRQKDPYANLPVLNARFNTISPVLREYLINIGSEFNRKWDTSIINGSGECKVEFTVNKEGNLVYKKIVQSSHNESLDNSVLLALSAVNSFDVPPDDYKGEKVLILFKINPDRNSFVKFPNR